ncbi:ANM_HP_G0247960.mRNA.1.CDS.1 [Saccharomyces cerevisiae]|nr:ANM_HP_G0247960.mRNA.1.CDS.1 [Saccharomyces cerevisiae]CAI7005570.1 ANM_HP_G0247960.mRNA.1.CDS.1 [Saccharomyces cerevisiae]
MSLFYISNLSLWSQCILRRCSTLAAAWSQNRLVDGLDPYYIYEKIFRWYVEATGAPAFYI